MPIRPFAAAALGGMLTFTGGCATSQRPVLYPNAHLQAVGQATADRDINRCMQLAKQSGAAEGRAGRAAKNTAESATVGGAAGAAAGAVRGRTGEYAAAGAAGAGAARATHEILRSGEPDRLYRAFVNHCLRDRGYEPIGWR